MRRHVTRSVASSNGSTRIGINPAAVAPPTSITTLSPTYAMRDLSMPSKYGNAKSKIRGSGFVTPTTWLSIMHRTLAC